MTGVQTCALPISSRKPYWLAAHLVHRALGFAIAASALLFAGGAPGLGAARVAALALGISWTFMGLSTSGWLSWMADLVPEEVRGSFFLRRSAVFQTVTVTWFFAASVFLDLVPPSAKSVAYAVIFGVGTLGGLADILLHIGIPEPHFHKEEGSLGAAEFFEPLRDGNFLRYSLGIGVAVFAIFVAAPFQAPWLTDPAGIDAPNVWLGIMTVISILAWVAMAPLWGFVMDRYGRKPAVILGCLLVTGWVGYFFVDHRNYPYILPLIALFSGFFGPAFWEGSGQLMLTLAPRERRVVHIAWYNTIVGLVGALGPVAGGFLGERIGARRGLVLVPGLPPLSGFALSQAAALVFMVLALLILRGVREGKERPVAGLVGQIASAGLFRTYASLLDLRRHSGDPRVARALRRIDGDEGELVQREVIERLDDPEPEVREEALRALGRIGSVESREAIVAELLDCESDLRVEAARALGRLGDTASIHALEACMRDAGAPLREACAGAIGTLAGRPQGSPLAVMLEGESDDRVRAAAALGASSCPPGDDAEDDGFGDAALELFEGLAKARNQALRLQYAIGLANILGRPGDFIPLATGEEAGRAARRRAVFEALAREAGGVLAEESERAVAPELLAALDSGDGRRCLVGVLDAHDLVMRRLFGAFMTSGEFPTLLSRADSRLGAWDPVAAESRSRLAELADEASLLIALAGAHYLSSE